MKYTEFQVRLELQSGQYDLQSGEKMDISYSFVSSNHDVTIPVLENLTYLTLFCILQAKYNYCLKLLELGSMKYITT